MGHDAGLCVETLMNRFLIALVLVGFLALELVFPGKPDADRPPAGHEAVAAPSGSPPVSGQQDAHASLIERIVDLARKFL